MDANADGGRDADKVKKQAKVSNKEFSTAELHVRFESHVTRAQDAFLKGDNALAETEATLALRIRPTAHLFALLAVVAESKGQFDRASDFRLLQAFLARDAVLWEELLQEFLSNQLFYKSVVCLQRMSALEKDPTRYRALQLQLADLLIGLGEIRRASNVLVPLWNGSRCKDFEVFALLSSLYFQLGKWNSLQALVTSSLKHSFGSHIVRPPSSMVAEANRKTEEMDGGAVRQARVSKRVRFFGLDANEGEGNDAETEDAQPPAESPASTTLHPDDPLNGEDEVDEFTFDDVGNKSAAPTTSGTTTADAGNLMSVLGSSSQAQHASEQVRSLYGQSVEITSPEMKKNFLTLVNVHSELLNESGKFMETIQLIEYTAAVLSVAVLELPPDLLVRLGTAYAFVGDLEQPCREVFSYLVETCAMEEYGDVLLDAAMSLQKVGMHAEALGIFETFGRYHGFVLQRLTVAADAAQTAFRAAEEAENELHKKEATNRDSALPATENAHLTALRNRHNEAQSECSDTKTVLTAAYAGIAQCRYSLGDKEAAQHHAEKALELDARHLQTRLLLGKIYYYEQEELDKAVKVLTPHEGEPALIRIQLGASLVRMFFRAKKYVEAIALGVSIFEIILSSDEDGDTQSVAPGSSRRSTAPLLMPTMSRASSAIIPARSLAGRAGLAGAVSSFGGGSTAGIGRISASLAASIQAGTSVYRQQLQRQGRSALTTTVYGASAAASVAAGWGREEEEEKLKDSSTIFRFNRKRAKRARDTTDAKEEASADDAGDGDADEEQAAARRARQRVEEVTKKDASDFWGEDPNAAKDEEGAPPTADAELGEDTQVKKENEGEGEEKSPPPPPPARRRGSKRDDEPYMSNNTVVGDKDRDLDDLEAFEQVVRDGDAVDDSVDPEAFALPSLDDISQQFDDPEMAKLFLSASTNEPTTATNADEDANATDVGLVGGADSALVDRATAREAIAAMGRTEFMALTGMIVDSYSALGQFTEAKEFAWVALSHFSQKRTFRQMGAPLERPLRLALLRAALAAGESEDAFRVGIRLLQEDTSEEDRNVVVELMHGVLSRCEDRSAILYRIFMDGDCDVAHLVLLGNRYMQTRSFVRVLNLYLMALKERPSDIYLNFMVGLSYLVCSHQKRTRNREGCVSAAVYYLSQYQTLLVALDPSRTGEALYNSARAMQYLKLHYLCVPIYERIARDLHVPSECSASVREAARTNLYFIYRWVSGNRELALSVLSPCPVPQQQ